MNKKSSHANSKQTAIIAALALLLLALIPLSGCDTNKPTAAASIAPVQKAKEAPPLFSFNGEIVLKGSDQLIGIMVFIAGSSHLAFTDDKGQYIISGIEAGNHIVMAQHPRYRTARIAEVLLDPEESTGTISLPPVQLQPDTRAFAAAQPTDDDPDAPPPGGVGILAGNITVPEGELVEAVRVAIEDLDLAVNPNTKGRFLITNIRPGDYDVDFELDGHDLEVRRVRIIGGHMYEIPETIVMLASDAVPAGNSSIMGKILILGAEGALVETNLKARVSIVETGESVTATSDLDFLFRNLAKGDYTLVAEAAGYSLQKPVTVSLTEEIANAVLVMEEEKGVLTGVITLAGGDGSNLAGSQVAVAGTAFSAITDTQGAFRLAGVPAGTHAVVCARAGYKAVEFAEVEILPSQTTDLGSIELQSDVEAPQILAITPENGTKNLMIEPENDFQVVFSKRMNTDSVRGAVSIQPECSFDVLRIGSGVEEGGNDILVIRILNGKSEAPLEFKKSYTLSVAQEATDTQGIALKEGAQIGFQTGGLMVMDTYPQADIDNVPVVGNTRLVIYFNGILNQKTMESDRSMSITPNPPVRSEFKEFRVDPRTGWTIFYNVPVTWKPDTKYLVKLSSGIKATDGTPLVPYRFNFKTEPERKHLN